MLNILRGELVKKGKAPAKAIIEALGCAEKTARNKLNGETDFTVPEAIKIIDMYFKDDNIRIDQLFLKQPRERTTA